MIGTPDGFLESIIGIADESYHFSLNNKAVSISKLKDFVEHGGVILDVHVNTFHRSRTDVDVKAEEE